jgi:hypothetical protein
MVETLKRQSLVYVLCVPFLSRIRQTHLLIVNTSYRVRGTVNITVTNFSMPFNHLLTLFALVKLGKRADKNADVPRRLDLGNGARSSVLRTVYLFFSFRK